MYISTILALLILAGHPTFAEGKHADSKARETNDDVRNEKYLASCGEIAKSPTPKTAVKLDDKTLAAYDILRNRCASCHAPGSPNGAKNFTDILSVEHLIQTGIIAKQDGNSKLLREIKSDNMPQDGTRLTQEEKKVLSDWISAGAKSFAPAASQIPEVGNISDADIEACMAKDLKRNVDKNDARFIRYLNLANLYNSDRREELERTRLAINKLFNSVSWKQQIKNPQVVDGTGTLLRLDLRDYDLSASDWEEIAKINPYPTGIDSVQSRELQDKTKTKTPGLRGDWVVFAASRPPLYHTLLKLPQKGGGKGADELLESLLKVDTNFARETGEETRAGFTQSNVTKSNRAISHFPTVFGSYWKSDDFKTKLGDQNILEHPLDAKPDGGEFIFSLPNGLHGYLITDAAGNRLDGAPKDVVIDPHRLNRDEVVLNGVSCMNCHQKGIKRRDDDVREHYELLANKFPNDASIQSQKDGVTRNFKGNEQLNKLYGSDEQAYRIALSETGNTVDARDPIFATGEAFETPLDLKAMAAELNALPDELDTVLHTNAELAKSLGIGQQTTVDRAVFNNKFAFLKELIKQHRKGNDVSGLVEPKIAAERERQQKIAKEQQAKVAAEKAAAEAAKQEEKREQLKNATERNLFNDSLRQTQSELLNVQSNLSSKVDSRRRQQNALSSLRLDLIEERLKDPQNRTGFSTGYSKVIAERERELEQGHSEIRRLEAELENLKARRTTLEGKISALK